jgi:glycosyltransferase involved in cell wall biosynthesis
MTAVIFIPTLSAGGAERVASILANVWASYRDTTVTIVLMFDDERFFDVDARVKIVSLGLRPRQRPIVKFIQLLQAVIQLRRVVLRERPLFVLSFMNRYNVFCLFALLWSGVTTIVSERDSLAEPGLRLIWLLRQLLYPTARGVIVQTALAADQLQRRVQVKDVAVIYNPVTAPLQSATRRQERFILNVARLHKKKGHADLIRAFGMLRNRDWKLVLCGDGPLRQDIENLTRQLGLAERVVFAGQTKDVDRWYARAGIFAFSSYFEGFPNALAEAMVAGLPVVSYDCPTGPSELIKDGRNGYLVQVGDIAGLAARLDELIEHPERASRMASAAKRVIDIVGSDAISAKYFRYCMSVRP